jgi:mannitol/fructose-specific phosphotransferase system IIA component (Ntr-type)
LIGQHSVAESLIHRSVGLTVIVVDATETESTSTYELPPEGGNHKPAKAAPAGTGLAELVGVERVMIFDRPITRQDLFQQIAQRLSGGDSKIADLAIKRVEEREQTGSTFLNEGVALPHARIEGLESPRAAIALTHEGVLDAHTQHPVEVVFMLLTPASAAGTHLKILAKVGRMLQNRDLRRQLLKSKTPEAAWELVYRWEQETL